MNKAALLIGVSEYESDFSPLPAARADTEAMSRVLRDPELGGFDQVSVLLDPSRQQMEQEIEILFSASHKDDLVLLYFSGHAVKDEMRRLYLTTTNTRKSNQRLVRSTAVSANFIQEVMSISRSRRQVIILDCSFSGAFARDMSTVAVKGNDSIDVASQLGGSGRVILTSSSSVEYSFEQKESNLSIFTRFLVEGIATGVADQDMDGLITADELYQYARQRVLEVVPSMQPEIYVAREGYKIILARSPQDNPKLLYRKEVTNLTLERNKVDLSPVARRRLHVIRGRLGISEAEAGQIEEEILKPHRELQNRLEEYKNTFIEVVNDSGYPLDTDTISDLKDFQQLLGLREEDITEIEEQVISDLSIHTNSVSSSVKASYDDLSSDRGLDYSQLRDLLRSQNWKAANYETYITILKQVGRREGDSIREEEIKQFSCVDLRTLDQLWVKYSEGRFGFSIQKQIYLECGGRFDDDYDDNAYKRFGDLVGWRSKGIWIPYYDLTFGLSAPLGHLPRPGGWVKVVPSLFTRLEVCRL